MDTTQKKRTKKKQKSSGEATNSTLSRSCKHLPEGILERMRELEEKYSDLLEVARQIDKLPMESYHLEKFKEKWRGEL